jgi:hypothetical protein
MCYFLHNIRTCIIAEDNCSNQHEFSILSSLFSLYRSGTMKLEAVPRWVPAI